MSLPTLSLPTAALAPHQGAALDQFEAATHEKYALTWPNAIDDYQPGVHNWDSEEPAEYSMLQYEAEMVWAMGQTGVDPAVIYAFQQTGLLVTEQNQSLINPVDLEEYHAAIARYDALHSS